MLFFVSVTDIYGTSYFIDIIKEKGGGNVDD